jgi:hypothetical protein
MTLGIDQQGGLSAFLPLGLPKTRPQQKTTMVIFRLKFGGEIGGEVSLGLL